MTSHGEAPKVAIVTGGGRGLGRRRRHPIAQGERDHLKTTHQNVWSGAIREIL
jgi:hypothetical protein